MKQWIGLDPAHTLGIAMWFPENQLALVFQVTGNPIYQLHFMEKYVLGEPKYQTFLFERLHHFRNAKTTRSLLERVGFLRYSLEARGFQPLDASSESARKELGLKGKQETYDFFLEYYDGCCLSDHHTDALAIALLQSGVQLDKDKFKIRDGRVG